MDRLVVPFRRWHLDWLLDAGDVETGKFPFERSVAATLEGHNSWTAMVDGETMACGGTIQQWPGRHVAWALLNGRSGPYMKFVTGAALRVLQDAVGRIEMTVRADFAQGHRWAALLGFEVETPVLKNYGPEGEPHTAYVRFNKG